MKLLFYLFLILLSFGPVWALDIINKNCIPFVKQQKYIHTKLASADEFKFDELDQKDWNKSKVYSTERFFYWDRISKDYKTQIKSINTNLKIKQEMEGCIAHPDQCRSLVECPEMGSSTDFGKCEAYTAFCREELIKGGINNELVKWQFQEYNCSQDWYLKTEKHIQECEHDALKEIEYLRGTFKNIQNTTKDPHTKAYLAKANEDFGKIQGDLLKAREKIIANRKKKELAAKKIADEKKKIVDNAAKCKKYLQDKHWNPKNRNLVDELLPNECSQVGPADFVPQDFIQAMSKLDDHMNDQILNQMMDQVQTESLMNTFMSTMSMEENFHGVKQPRGQNLKTLLCQKNTCNDPHYSSVASKAVAEYLKVIPSNVPTFWDDKRLDKDTTEFNNVIDDINSFCAESRKEHNKAFGSDLVHVPELTYGAGTYQSGIVEAVNTPKAQELLNRLSHTRFAKLMFSSSFSSHVGVFDIKKCVKGGMMGITKLTMEKIPTEKASRNALLKSATMDLEKSGKAQAHELINDRKLIKEGSEDEKIEVLKKYIKASPEAFKQFLASNPGCDDFTVTCKLISKILSDDGFDLVTDYVVGGVSALAAAAGAALLFTGVGTPVGAALISASTVLGTLGTATTLINAERNYVIAQDDIHQQQLSGVTNNRDQDKAFLALNDSRLEKKTAISDAGVELAMSLTPLAVGKVVGKLKNTGKVVAETEETLPNGLHVDDVMKQIEMTPEVRTKAAYAYFDNLPPDKKIAFDDFKKEIHLENFPKEKQDQLIESLYYDVHKENNTPNLLWQKKKTIVDAQNLMKEMGIDPAVAEKQVRILSSEEYKILGETQLPGYTKQHTQDLRTAINELKADPSKVENMKNEYEHLLSLRFEAMKDMSKYKNELKNLDADIKYIEDIYPRTSELKQVKANFKNNIRTAANNRAEDAEKIRQQKVQEDAAKKANEEQKSKDLADAKTAIDKEKAIHEFQIKNPDYKSVKSSFNATDFKRWSQEMRNNNVSVSPEETVEFIKDYGNYSKGNHGIFDGRDAAENFIGLIEKSNLDKTNDLESFDVMVHMLNKQQMPSQKRILTAIDKTFDYSKLRISDEQFKILEKAGADVQAIKNQQLIGAKAYLDHLPPGKQKVFDDFKRATTFDSFPKNKQDELYIKMSNTHYYNNADDGKVVWAKKEDLVEIQQDLQKLGVTKDVAENQVRELAKEENMILGQKNIKKILTSSTDTREAINMMDNFRNFKRAGNKGDFPIQLQSIEEARNYAYSFKPLKYYGFPPIDKLNWTKFISNMKKSALFGKRVGYETQLADGSWARVRLDWDPINHGHYNVEMVVPGHSQSFESVGFQIEFKCGGLPCTEAQVAKIAESFN